MAKKVKLPLIMADGVQVRTLEALKESFDVERVVGYFLEGKLQTWLEDRYYEDEAEAVAALSKEDAQLGRKLSEIFDVEYVETEAVDVEEIAWKNERLAKLKQLTDDDEIIKNIDSVAFNQEELADLYEEGVEKIYLCEGEFNIPKSKQKLEYIQFAGAKVKGLKEVKNEEKMPAKSRVSSYCFSNDYNSQLMILDNGKLHIQGNTANGEDRLPNTKSRFICVSHRPYHCIAVTENGNVFTWGSLPYNCESQPNMPPIKQAIAAPYGFYALDADGKVYRWGGHWFYNGDDDMPDELPAIKQIVASFSRIYALDVDGKIHSWGKKVEYEIPKNIPPIKKLSSDYDVVFALGENGCVYSWGNDKDMMFIPDNLPHIVDIGDVDIITPLLDDTGHVHWCGVSNWLSETKEACTQLPPLKAVFGECYVGIDENNVLWKVDYNGAHTAKLYNKEDGDEIKLYYNNTED